MKRLKCFLISSVLMLSSSIPISATYNVINSKQKITVDGKNIDMESLNINGNNYLKAADTAKLLNIDISFDQSTNTIHFDKTKPFTKVRIVGEKQKNNSANEKQKYLDNLQYIYDTEKKLHNITEPVEMRENYSETSEYWGSEIYRISQSIFTNLSEDESKNFLEIYNYDIEYKKKYSTAESIKYGDASSGLTAYYKALSEINKVTALKYIDYYFDNNLNTRLNFIESNKYIDQDTGLEIEFLDKYSGKYSYVEGDWKYDKALGTEMKVVEVSISLTDPIFLYSFYIIDRSISETEMYADHSIAHNTYLLHSEKYTLATGQMHFPETCFRSEQEKNMYEEAIRNIKYKF